MLERASSALRRCTELVIMVLMAILVVIVVAGVFFRYVLGSSIPWSEEIGRYVMVWVGFLGASLAMREGLHVGVEFVVKSVPGRLAVWLSGLARTAVAGFLFAVIGYGISLVAALWDQVSPVAGVRMTWPYLAIPVGSLLMLIQLATPAKQEAR
jgi:TRAP-type C4-dicarboxylate transport system permease small subunit